MSKNRNVSSRVKSLCTKPEYGANEIRDPNGILAQLFRRLLHRVRFNHRSWPKYLNDYIDDVCDERVSHRARTNEKGNLTKALCNPYMTIRSLTRGIGFLKIRRYRLALIVELENGEEITVSSDDVLPTYGRDLFTEEEITEINAEDDMTECDEPEFEDELPPIDRV